MLVEDRLVKARDREDLVVVVEANAPRLAVDLDLTPLAVLVWRGSIDFGETHGELAGGLDGHWRILPVAENGKETPHERNPLVLYLQVTAKSKRHFARDTPER
jgi:hypothetical protein